jgi:hypothetical protein
MGDLWDLRKFALYVEANKNTNSASGIRLDYGELHPGVDMQHLREVSEQGYLAEESRIVHIKVSKGAYENKQLNAYRVTLQGRKLIKRFGSFWAWVDENDKRVNIIIGFVSGIVIGIIGIVITSLSL